MSEQSDPLRLLSLREAGAVLGIDWKAVRALVETGEIGAYRTGATGQPRIPRLALVAWQERVAQLCYAPPDLAGYDPDAEVAPPVKRARRGKNGREYITTGVRFAVLRRGGFRCAYCGRPASEVPLHVDHILPIAKGGSNDPDNLCAACQECNNGKRAKVLDPSEVVAWAKN